MPHLHYRPGCLHPRPGLPRRLFESTAGPPDGSLETTKLPAVPGGKAWKRVWNDEFDGDRLDEEELGDPPGPAETACGRRSRSGSTARVIC